MSLGEYKQEAKRYTREDEWFRTVVLTLVGATAAWLLPKDPGWLVLVALFLIAVGLVTRQMLHVRKRVRAVEQLLAANKQLRAPDALAEQRVRLGSEPYLVVGSAVETLIHSTLNTNANYLDKGWDPAHVQIVDTKRTMDPNPILDRMRIPGRLIPLKVNEMNGPKFVLYGHSHPFKDDEDNLSLSFVQTDWQTHNTVRNHPNGVEANNELALEFGNLETEMSRVPSSVGLHYIVRFNDDWVLLMRRASHVAHDPNKWSISGEEQFKPEDFQDGTLSRVFRRALCEEVVGLYDPDPATLDARWRNHVNDRIRTMKLWGLVFEEHACVTSLLGFFQFGISKNDFLKWHNELVDLALGTRDKEGKLYCTTTEELDLLLRAGSCKAWKLFEPHPEPVQLLAEDLAKTSRYRACRLVFAIKGKLGTIGPEGLSVLGIK
jgi:hypothetical protein